MKPSSRRWPVGGGVGVVSGGAGVVSSGCSTGPARRPVVRVAVLLRPGARLLAVPERHRLELADLLVESGRRTEALSVLGAAQEADRNIAIRMASIRWSSRVFFQTLSSLPGCWVNTAT